jgi:hypothetical protein
MLCAIFNRAMYGILVVRIPEIPEIFGKKNSRFAGKLQVLIRKFRKSLCITGVFTEHALRSGGTTNKWVKIGVDRKISGKLYESGKNSQIVFFFSWFLGFPYVT